MPRFILAPAAEEDIQSILAWTHEHFGEPARLRYEALLIRAMTEVADDPDRFGSFARPEIAREIRTYHVHYSRNRTAPRGRRVKRPRHFILYRRRADGVVEIGRILHESVDLKRHVPENYLAQTELEGAEEADE